MLIGSWVRAESGIKLTSLGLSLRVPDSFGHLMHRKQLASLHPKLNAGAVAFVVAEVAGDSRFLIQAGLGPLEVALADSGGAAAGWKEFGAIENGLQVGQPER